MSATITEQSAEVSANAAGRLPQAVMSAFAESLRELREQGTPAGAISAGDTLEDFTLPDATGKRVSLSDLVAVGPAVIVFYRGDWCPYCNIALHTYQAELLPKLGAYGATLVAISPQAPDQSLTFKEKAELTFPVLSDHGADVARRAGIAFEPSAASLEAQHTLGLDIRKGNASGTTDLPMPTVLVVDESRTVRFADTHADYTSRTEVAEILDALSALSRS
jgi:peroxiredoxin